MLDLICYIDCWFFIIRFFILFVCNSLVFLPNGKNSNILIIVAFSNSPFSRKTSSPTKNSCLPIFLDDKAEILTAFLSKSY